MEIKDIANNSDETLEDFASLVDQYPPASTETDNSAPAAPCKKDSRNVCLFWQPGKEHLQAWGRDANNLPGVPVRSGYMVPRASTGGHKFLGYYGTRKAVHVTWEDIVRILEKEDGLTFKQLRDQLRFLDCSQIGVVGHNDLKNLLDDNRACLVQDSEARYFLKEKVLSKKKLLSFLVRAGECSIDTLANVFSARRCMKTLNTLLAELVEDGQVEEIHSSSKSKGKALLYRAVAGKKASASVDETALHEGYVLFNGKSKVVRYTTSDGRIATAKLANSRALLLDGDKVVCELLISKKEGFAAAVHRIVARSITPVALRIVGRDKKGKQKKQWWGVDAGSRRCNFLVRENSAFGRLYPEDIVLCRITEEKEGNEGDYFTAEVIRVVDSPMSIKFHERLVRLNHLAPGEFPSKARLHASKLAQRSEDLQGRRDLRDIALVTIDGADARDFDDAICVTRTDCGYLLQVAIADVSHYVRQGDPLDEAALKRGNSWYFPTSVVPMLPFALSNDLCSLVPHKDRLVVSADIHIDSQGHVLKTSFAPAVMRSKARLTYDEARDLVHEMDEATSEKFAPEKCEGCDIRSMLQLALELAELLKKRRLARGALDFDFPDSKAVFDTGGHLSSYSYVFRHEMHCLIEEFMLCANEAVASFLGRTDLPFLYRVHEEPSYEKLQELYASLKHTRFMKTLASKTADPSLRQIMDTVRGTENEGIVGKLCVRALPIAMYSPYNIGHFGLASPAYCHFTSPIRRYADLLVHRVLKRAIGADEDAIHAGKTLDIIATRINDDERSAQLAEREMNKRLACLWMLDRKKTEYIGHINSVQHYGAFVSLDEVPVEGLIPYFSSGRARNLVLGSRVKVFPTSISLTSLFIDFALVEVLSRGNTGTQGKGRANEANI